MYKHLTVLICLLMTFPANATQVHKKELEELVMESDVIVEVDIADVYGKDKFSAISRDPEMQTGPGLDNEIVLYVCSYELLLNVESVKVPKCFETAIWKKWHVSLGSFVDYQSQRVILLLKGEGLKRVHPGHFIWSLEDKSRIIELIKKRDTVK